MPGREVKNWPMYEALRNKGMSKREAAMTTNAKMKEAKRGRRGHHSPARHRKRSGR